jgi:NADH-quinone oxidoreductase subunit J
MIELISSFLSGNVLLFLFFALAALGTGVMVLFNQNPVRSALFLVLNLFSVAVLYLLLNAYFLAAVQVIVYAGAIMVLFLFVIMLLNLGTPDKSPDKLRGQQPVALGAGLVLVGIVGALVMNTALKSPASIAGTQAVNAWIKPASGAGAMGTAQAVGNTLYNPSLPWLFPFEATSVLLLVATVGAVVLAQKHRVKGETSA